MPDLKLPFVVETDAFAVAVGVVLNQSGRPLAFFSKKNEFQTLSFLRLCMRDVRHYRIHKKMVSISHRSAFQDHHRPKEPKHTTFPNHTNPRATEMDNKITRV